MITVALALAVSVAILTLVAPVLRRITERGHTPLLSVLSWLSISVTVLVSWALAGIGALWVPHHGPMWMAVRLDSIALTGASWPVDALRYTVGVLLVLPLIRFLCFLVDVLVRARRDRGSRRGALRLLGHREAGADGVLEVSSDVPMVYCMPGRPGIIVVTSAARDSLDAEEFAAVLAHERAHLVERHHLLVAVAHAIGRVSRRMWLFRHTERLVRVLVEMRADDVAVRRFDPDVVAVAMGRLSTLAPPAPALAASGSSVVARILRMADPPTRGRRALAALGACSFAGLSCAVQVVMVAMPVIAMTVGDKCLYMTG